MAEQTKKDSVPTGDEAKPFYVESWYESLKEVTFQTEFVQLTFEEGRTLFSLCKVVKKLKETIADLDAIDLSKLSDLAQRIDTVIIGMKEKAEEKAKAEEQKEEEVIDFGVFAKLSFRSPSDVIRNSLGKAIREIFETTPEAVTNASVGQRLQALYRKGCQENETITEQQIHELIKASMKSMKVVNAKQILRMFVNSERILQDIGSAIESGKDKFCQNVVIREWIPIDIDMEFRGFCYNGKLNALSSNKIYSERLVKKKEEIGKRIQNFFNEKIKDKMQDLDTYVVDFAICGDNLETILVIEFNPFNEATDGGLFSWKTDTNRLENGPFEFRVITINNKPNQDELMEIVLNATMN